MKEMFEIFFPYLLFELVNKTVKHFSFGTKNLFGTGDDTRVFGLEPFDGLFLCGLVTMTNASGTVLLSGNVESYLTKQ